MPTTFNLDHASGAPLNKTARNAVKVFLETPIYNTDSAYAPAVESRRYLADLKSKTAKLIGVKAPNILITSGSSDANSILLEAIHSAEPKGQFTTTNIEHSSLLKKVEDNPEHIIIKVTPTGAINSEDISKFINDQTLLVSIQYVNNETGQVLPIKDISKVIKKIREERSKNQNKLPLFFHTDASQAVITQDVQILRLGVDAMSINGSKFGALPNTGILYLSSDILRWLNEKDKVISLKKENPLSTISLYHALNHAIDKKNTESKRLLSLSKAFWAKLQEELPEAKLNPTNLKIGKNHSPHILNVHIPRVSGEKLVILAGLNNILISTGAACSASKDKPSHVLQALGLSSEQIQSSIRVSFGSDNKSEKEVIDAAIKLAQLCKNKSVRLT